MTLIEVLITIVVFSSGILVILAIVTNGLALGSRSRNRTVATMLAKEGLEMAYSIRDTNIDKAQPRGCLPVVGDPCPTNPIMTSSTTLVLTLDGTGANGILSKDVGTLGYEQRRLYTSTGGQYTIYSHNPTGNKTRFLRYITISPILDVGDDQTFIDSQIKKITSTVEYSQLGGTGIVTLESFIGLTRQ